MDEDAGTGMKPIHLRCAAMVAALLLAFGAGCSGPVLRTRSQSPELSDRDENVGQTKYVSQYAVPVGTHYVKLEGPVLITGLRGTGSDPPPGAQRAMLLADMQARKVQKPNQILADPNNSLAWVEVWLPPGVQKGDRLDVEVRVPPQNDTTSIAGGFMMSTRLRQMAILSDNRIHDGQVMAVAEGPVLVDPISSDNQDPMALKRGMVLGGGAATYSRTIELALKPDERSVYRSKQIGDALNRRFHVYVHGIKQGIANPLDNERITLMIHPRYKQNLARYFHIIRAVPLGESPTQLQARLEVLERRLTDPLSAQDAAIKLEAVGKDAIRVLEKGLQSKDPEVQFYSAEALAYLDQPSATPILAETAKKEPAFRACALAALCALNDVHAADVLRELFDVPSAETRYGAFRALWAMNANDPQLHAEHLGKKFWLHVIPSAGPAMVHVTHSYRPEVVLFGEEQKFELPIALEAGNAIIVKSQPDGQIRVSRFAAGEKDQHSLVANSVDEVIRAIAEVGGDYPDVVQALEEARVNGALLSRFEVDAIPQAGRAYDRNRKLAKADSATAKALSPTADEKADQEEVSGLHNQLPTLFGGAKQEDVGKDGATDASDTDDGQGTAEAAIKSLEKSTRSRPGFSIE
ncbi:MAG: flagellar basal body P-ring protein FlgI [Pirellulales bacterium]|nr:flagellar basal body P-ring protein FlgI [Pirellulales bacterium]